MSSLPRIDLDILLEEPEYRGSVQDLFALKADDKGYFLSRTSESGSVFDVGAIFSVPRSGMLRSAVRHYIYTALEDPATWGDITEDDVRACFGREEVARDLLEGELLKHLRRQGADTHHAGMVDPETGEVISGRMPDEPSSLVLIEKFPVYRPERFELWGGFGWDYSRYFCAERKVVGLEHVFRLGSPGGSSLLSRYDAAMRRGEDEAERLLSSMGLEHAPRPWGLFKNMLYECTTKYEPSDRELDWQETLHLSGVPGELFKRMVKTLCLCTVYVRKFFAELGFQLWDIKWECAMDHDRVVVVDTIDPDSIRVTGTVDRDGRTYFIHFNKQSIRDYYKLVHKDWYDSIVRAKTLARTDSQGRDFMQIYREKVDAGEFPDIPEYDPAYGEIQSRKYALMVEPLLGKLSPDEARAEASDLMNREINYYRKMGKLDQFLSMNAAQ